jgi:hypothetical protein
VGGGGVGVGASLLQAIATAKMAAIARKIIEFGRNISEFSDLTGFIVRTVLCHHTP